MEPNTFEPEDELQEPLIDTRSRPPEDAIIDAPEPRPNRDDWMRQAH